MGCGLCKGGSTIGSIQGVWHGVASYIAQGQDQA